MQEVIGREEYEELLRRFDKMETLFQIALESTQLPQVVTIADICKYEKISRTQITTKERYLLPKFGISEFPDGVCRWKLQTYLEWSALSPNDKKTMYCQYLQRQQLRKQAKNA